MTLENDMPMISAAIWHLMHCHSALPYSKSLNSGQPRVLKNLSVFERCPLLGGNLKNIVTFGTKRFARSSLYNILDNRGKWQNLKQEKLSIGRKRIALLFFGVVNGNVLKQARLQALWNMLQSLKYWRRVVLRKINIKKWFPNLIQGIPIISNEI